MALDNDYLVHVQDQGYNSKSDLEEGEDVGKS